MRPEEALLARAAAIIEDSEVHCRPCLQEGHGVSDCNNSMGCEGCGHCPEQSHELWKEAAWLKDFRAWRDGKERKTQEGRP